MTAPLVAFRCDATPKVALGHLRRCLALAEALRRAGATAVFLCADDPAARATLAGAGFESVWLAHEVAVNDDLSATLAHLGSLRPALVMVDSYAADDGYLAALRGGAPLVGCFDDLGRGGSPVDVVINGLPDAASHGYRAAVRLLGPRYLILGPEYWEPPPRTAAGTVREALVTMGGIDHYDLSSRLIRLFDETLSEARLHVVIGPYYKNRTAIRKAAAAARLAVALHEAPPSLRPLMAEADLAVSAGGFTLYELAAMGVPTVGVALWDNQRANVEALGARGTLVPLHYAEGPGFDVALRVAVTALAADRERRRSLAANGPRFIDGQGAPRVARAILQSINHPAGAVL